MSITSCAKGRYIHNTVDAVLAALCSFAPSIAPASWPPDLISEWRASIVPSTLRPCCLYMIWRRRTSQQGVRWNRPKSKQRPGCSYIAARCKIACLHFPVLRFYRVGSIGQLFNAIVAEEHGIGEAQAEEDAHGQCPYLDFCMRISAHLDEVPPGACIARHNNRSFCLVG